MSDLGQSAPVDPPVNPPPVNNGENKKHSIDIDILIAEVKKHPSLYNKSNNDQLDKTGRQKEWEDVCQVLFSNWDTLCSRKKIEKMREVQRKWRRLKEDYYERRKPAPKTYSPAVKKKQQQRCESMSFLMPTKPASDVDMGACAFQKNNYDKYPEGMEAAPQYEQPQGAMTEAIAGPSTSGQEPHHPSIDVENFARTYEIKKAPYYIPMPQIPEPIIESPLNANLHFALMLVPLLNRLSSEQLFDAWPKILKAINEAEGPKKLQILQNELKYRPGPGPSSFVPPYSAQVHMPGLADHYPSPLHGSGLVDYPGQEVAMPLGEDVDSIPPVTHGRPTNERGEIMYPETDHEDLDEV